LSTPARNWGEASTELEKSSRTCPLLARESEDRPSEESKDCTLPPDLRSRVSLPRRKRRNEANSCACFLKPI
jgi:hypothetical protein